MSFIHNSALAGASGQGGVYEIEQSLRFNQGDSTYLNWTPGSAGSVKKWTWSGWVKRGKGGIYGQGGDYHPASIVAYDGSTYNLPVYFGYNTEADQALFYYGNTPLQSKTSQVFRDFSGWYHFVAHLDTDQATAANRQKLYVNGVEVTAWATQNLPSQGDSAGKINTTSTHRIGWTGVTGQQYFDGYMAECHFVDGQALDPTDFGEFDESGVWRPIRYTGSYGTNGFYLKFDPTATNGIGHDHSGNGNNWTPSGFTTSGTGTDVMSDTPTTNWCTLSPLDKTDGGFGLKPDALSDGNLVDSSAYNSLSKGTIGVTSGKWYFEFTGWNSTSHKVGVALVPPTSSPLSNTDLKLLNYNGQYQSNAPTGTAGGTTYGGSISSTDIIGVAIDMDNRTIAWAVNGQYGDGSGNWDETYANASKINLESTGGVTPCCLNGSSTGTARTFNFGQRDFAYTPPTGFKALNTSNLPAPDIADGSQKMMPVLWTGTGSARTQTGYNFQPDLLWIMRRNASGMFVRLHDVVRGDNGTVMYKLSSDSNANEDTDTDVTGLTSSGFTIGNDGTDHPNVSGSTYVGWGWKAGQSSGSSNTDGSITSTVSANSGVFSIVSYTGTGSNATIGHGLGVAPGVVITKARTGSQNWAVYHKSLGATQALYLDLPSKQEAQSAYWQNTAPTSSVFYVGTNTRTGGLTANYIAYCFAEVEGYSKFGTYTGNANADGPFVYTGFKPAWVVLKTYAGGSEDEWFVYDNQRSPYNLAYQNLRLSTTNAENTDSTNASIDILSNGFKLRHSGTNTNENNTLFAYIAFASNPFGGFGVSPATAR